MRFSCPEVLGYVTEGLSLWARSRTEEQWWQGRSPHNPIGVNRDNPVEKPDFSRALTDRCQAHGLGITAPNQEGPCSPYRLRGVCLRRGRAEYEKRRKTAKGMSREMLACAAFGFLFTQSLAIPTSFLFPLSLRTQLALHGPLGVAMLSGAFKKLKCFLRGFQQNASGSELMQSQGELSALTHKMNELSKHSAHMEIADEFKCSRENPGAGSIPIM